MASKIDFGSVSYAVSIVSVVLAFFSPFAGLVLGIIGYVQSKRRNVPEAKKLSMLGIVISIIFIIIAIVTVVFYGENINSAFP